MEMVETKYEIDLKKLKFELFQELQRTNKKGWDQYWSAFQQFLLAKISLQEFKQVAESLLTPAKSKTSSYMYTVFYYY
jgi:hypothetical protein